MNVTLKVTTSICVIEIHKNYINSCLYLNSYLATESYSPKDILMQYYGNSTKPGANVPFNFGLLTVDKRNIVESIDKEINEWLGLMPEHQVANWVVSVLKYNASKKILNANKIKYDKGTDITNKSYFIQLAT